MRPLLLIVAFASTIGTASPALAQPDAYLELSTAGAAASSAGRHDEAYALFQQAHAVFPNARSSRAMGATAFQLRRYADAIRHYEAALSDERRPLTPEQRAQADEELGVARRLVGRTRVTVMTPAATATIDGDDIALDTTLVLDPGAHELVVRAAGHIEQRRSFTTRAGEDHPFEITLDPIASAGASLVDPADAVGASISTSAPARTVRVHVEGTSDDLTLQRVTGSAGPVVVFSPLCAAPCDVEIEPGTHSFGVSHGQGGAQLADHNMFTLDGDTSLELEYGSSDGLHIAGWVGGGIGLVGGLMLMFLPAAINGGPLSERENFNTFVTGVVIAAVAYIVGAALVFQNDHADIREVQ